MHRLSEEHSTAFAFHLKIVQKSMVKLRPTTKMQKQEMLSKLFYVFSHSFISLWCLVAFFMHYLPFILVQFPFVAIHVIKLTQKVLKMSVIFI